MPTILAFHSQYWEGNRHTGIVTPPAAGGRGGYPLWQSSVTVSVFGPPLDYLKLLWDRLCWSWRVMQLVWAVPPQDRDWLVRWLRSLPTFTKPERAVYDRLLGLMTSDTWPLAQQAVQTTATTLGFNDGKFWKSISTKVHDDPGHAAQLFRSLQARHLVKAQQQTISSHDLNFVVEAAYHAFTQIPKRTV